MIVPCGPRLRSQRPVGGCALPIRPRLLHICEYSGVRPHQRHSRFTASALSSSWRYLAGLSGAKWAGDQPAEEAFADGLAQELAAPSISAQRTPSASTEGSSVLSRSVMATWADCRQVDHADLEDWIHKGSYEVESSLEVLTERILLLLSISLVVVCSGFLYIKMGNLQRRQVAVQTGGHALVSQESSEHLIPEDARRTQLPAEQLIDPKESPHPSVGPLDAGFAAPPRESLPSLGTDGSDPDATINPAYPMCEEDPQASSVAAPETAAYDCAAQAAQRARLARMEAVSAREEARQARISAIQTRLLTLHRHHALPAPLAWLIAAVLWAVHCLGVALAGLRSVGAAALAALARGGPPPTT